MRKLVTIRTVKDVQPIPNADAIECITVDGWELVAKKNEFGVGDKCVYFEIDSFLPADDERFQFLLKTGTKKDESGKERIRLRTVKLRGQISQGLALPLEMFPEIDANSEEDLSSYLNVIKYERPEPKAANVAGQFPEWIKKTDEERIQNVYEKYKEKYQHLEFVPTLKLDGSSITMAYIPPKLVEKFGSTWEEGTQPKALVDEHGGQFIVCSRNLQLKYDSESHFWKGFFNSDWQGFMKWVAEKFDVDHPVVVQGELMGPGIQGNREKLADFKVFAFNMFNPLIKDYTPFGMFTDLIFQYFGHYDNIVPVGYPYKVLQHLTLKEILTRAEGRSINHPVREGIVWKSVDNYHPTVSFKAISNQFLLKGGE